MSDLQPLHVAKCLTSLDAAAASKGLTLLRTSKPKTLMKVASTLYSRGMNSSFDQETTYMYLYRFLILYENLLQCHDDRIYVESMLGREAHKAKMRIEELRELLSMRYDENELLLEKQVHKVTESVPKKCQPKFFENLIADPFITCQDLYSVIDNPDLSILIIDARSSEDYKDSRISYDICINIPENIIQAGLSAHKLGGLLPKESIEKWEKRDTYDLIVLLDWRTSRANFPASKLEKLKTTMVTWDTGRNYKEEPVILDYGFMEWLEIYPMLCTSATLLYSKSNLELDDLLDLDEIKYPTETETPIKKIEPPKTPVPTDNASFSPSESSLVPSTEPSTVSLEPPSVPDLTDEKAEKDSEQQIRKNRNLACEILKLENSLRNVRQALFVEKDAKKTEKLKVEEANLRKQIFDLSVIDSQFNINDDSTAKEELDLNKIKSEQRENLLAVARQAKKPLLSNATPESPKPTGIPRIDRSTKPEDGPIVFPYNQGGISVNQGLAGLHNIHNTCYLNTILQCLRQLPQLFRLYCSNNTYADLLIPKPKLTIEFSNIIRSLWRTTYSYINPKEFYHRIISLKRTYGAGNHEDCFEFFLLVLNNLSDDCAKNIDSQLSWTESQMAWYKQHSGKTSFYIRNFYHQMKCTSNCEKCRNSLSIKYEVDNVIYLHIPDKFRFSLTTALDNYLQDRDRIHCKKCNGYRVITKSVNVYPTVLVIGLKRHMTDQYQNIIKNEALCEFPLKGLNFAGVKYNLRTIALHSGTCNSGHYTSIALNCVDNKWYEYNDERVYSVKVDDDNNQRRAYGFFYSIDDQSYRNTPNISDKILTISA